MEWNIKGSRTETFKTTIKSNGKKYLNREIEFNVAAQNTFPKRYVQEKEQV